MQLNKILLFCFLTFTITSVFAQEPTGWIKLQSPTNETLRRLYFVDENNGWAVSLGGKIISTTDAGNSWQIQNSMVTSPIVDIFFINANRGWAITYPSEPPFGTTILTTSNGGTDWVKDSVFFENEIFSTILFLDENVGFIGGNGIKKTTDGGLTWTDSFIEPGGVSTLPINKFSFYSKTFGYASGGRVDIAGVIWRTTDGGNNWSSMGLSPDQIYDVFIVDSLNAISLSGDPELLYPIGIINTTDAGITWDFTELPFFGVSFAIDFLDDKEGWSAAGYKFLSTNDSGKTWIEQFIFDSTIVYDLQFVDKYTGYACGENGVLLKYISYKKFAPDKPTFEIGQNHPNPFSEKTTFYVYSATPDFELPARAQIKLFDILGNEILTLADQDFYSGIYEFTFNPARDHKNISSGVYFLTLISGDVKQSMKILYIR
jgi:photosystem II stability/assembly factor-like uncharacterized protein